MHWKLSSIRPREIIKSFGCPFQSRSLKGFACHPAAASSVLQGMGTVSGKIQVNVSFKIWPTSVSIRQQNLPRQTQTQLHVYIALVLTGESTEGWSVGEPRLPFPRSTSRTCGCRLQGPSFEVTCGQREFNKQRGEEEEERLSVKAAVGTRGKYSPRLPGLPTPGLGD